MIFLSKALAAGVNINPDIPGLTPSTSISGLIQNFYSFALLIAGVLAVGAIVYGGMRYAVGHGNPSSESEGKSWIVGALLGLLLLASAYVILHTINPEITKLSIPGLPPLDAAPTGEGLGGGAPSNIYTSSHSSDPACQQRQAGTCVWLPNRAMSSTCSGYQSVWPDDHCNDPPPHQQCEIFHQC